MGSFVNNEPLDKIGRSAVQKAFGGGGTDSTYASDLYASLTRDQWANYVDTFIPIENKLIKYATDPSVVKDAMASASTDVNKAFNSQQGATQRRLSGLGVTLSADEQAASKKAAGLDRSLADVQSQNTARDLTTQRQQSILGSPVPQGAG